MTIVYHASPEQVVGATEPFAEFLAYSHFGSKAAAIGALIAKQCEGGYLYEVELNVLASQIVELPEDWGSPRRLPLLSEVTNSVEYADPGLFKILNGKRAQCISAKAEKSIEESERLATKALEEYSTSQDIRVFSYRNIVEGEEGALSYCVIYPCDVITLSCCEVTADELKNSRRFLSDFRLRMLGSKTD
jgi:hypothetical protein